MRLLFINQYYAPDYAATAQQLSDICEALAARGHEVHVLTSRAIYDGRKLDVPEEEILNGVRVHRVPISHEAVALIRLRINAVPKGCPFLFPGDVPGQPVVDLKRFWERMRVQAEIPDVRIHDLRHTFASMLVSGGASLEMIGRLLGHTQIGTTQRYAHLIDSPLRAGVNAVGEMLKPRLKVVGS